MIIPRERAEQTEAQFERTFLEHWPRVYGVLFRLVGDRAEAEDLALETFWRLWQGKTNVADNLGGWLYRVATRLGYNALRAAKRRQHYEENVGQEALAFDELPDPERETETALERDRIREVLKHMESRNARLLILRHSGLSYKEIAAALNVSPNSVGALLNRAEQEFERMYGGEHDPSK
jgi:RNA polymerase sigma-70 factor (ECF subfamily)